MRDYGLHCFSLECSYYANHGFPVYNLSFFPLSPLFFLYLFFSGLRYPSVIFFYFSCLGLTQLLEDNLIF